jgi:TonB family protein
MSRLRIATVCAVLAVIAGVGSTSAARAQTAPAGPPRALLKIAYADYPADALAKEIKGLVRVSITIDAAVEVTKANVLDGPPELRASAFKAAMGMKYAPAADATDTILALDYRLDALSWGVRVLQPMATGNFTSFGGAVSGGPGTSPGPAIPGPNGAYRVGGNIAPPRKIKDFAPVYPPAARQAGIQGVVILEAIIGVDGTVTNARVLRSIPLLDQAAIDAVKQWQYTPVMLSGTPVPIVMTVTVNFALRSELEITLPSGAKTRVLVDGGGGATLNVPGVGSFRFQVSNDGSPVRVSISQLDAAGSPPQL